MEIVGWVLVAVLGVVVAVLVFRRPDNPYVGAVDRLARELEKGGEVRPVVEGDPPEVGALRKVIATGWEPVREDRTEDPEERALRGLVRYLRGAALEPLQRAGGNGGAAVQDVVDALEDLEFYAAEVDVEEPSRQNLPGLIQEVAREYTRETDIPVKLRFSSSTIHAAVPPDSFKDALFLLLSNAGRFGGGKTVTIEAEHSAEGTRVRVIDRGTGFSPDALEHAFEPFWTTDRDAVGLGLTHARRLLHRQGIRLRIENREGGGGEAVIFLPTS